MLKFAMKRNSRFTERGGDR